MENKPEESKLLNRKLKTKLGGIRLPSTRWAGLEIFLLQITPSLNQLRETLDAVKYPGKLCKSSESLPKEQIRKISLFRNLAPSSKAIYEECLRAVTATIYEFPIIFKSAEEVRSKHVQRHSMVLNVESSELPVHCAGLREALTGIYQKFNQMPPKLILPVRSTLNCSPGHSAKLVTLVNELLGDGLEGKAVGFSIQGTWPKRSHLSSCPPDYPDGWEQQFMFQARNDAWW